MRLMVRMTIPNEPCNALMKADADFAQAAKIYG